MAQTDASIFSIEILKENSKNQKFNPYFFISDQYIVTQNEPEFQ